MAQYVTPTSPKKKKTAFWCCLIGGLFGAHEFYVGNIGKGFLYVFTIGGFLKCYWWDLWKILRGNFRDHHGMLLLE